MPTRRLRKFACLATLLALGSVVAPARAAASPWTLPADELTIGIDYTFQVAEREYLPDGTLQAFPLDGQFYSNSLRVGARYGFTDRFEGAMELEFKQLTFSAKTLLLDAPDGAGLLELNDAILDFNSARLGAGDFYLHGRYNLHRGRVVITSETTLKLPTGYDAPRGTFVVDADGTRVGGQATLGDAQTDLTQSLLFGLSIPRTGTFARLDGGLRLRFGAPGHQAVGGFKLGQLIGRDTIVLAGVRGFYTLTEGEQIGVTMVARDPGVPRSKFTADNIVPVPLKLDRDAAILDAGLILRVEGLEIVTNYSYTFWGRNISAVHAFSVGTVFALPDATAAFE